MDDRPRGAAAATGGLPKTTDASGGTATMLRYLRPTYVDLPIDDRRLAGRIERRVWLSVGVFVVGGFALDLALQEVLPPDPLLRNLLRALILVLGAALVTVMVVR